MTSRLSPPRVTLRRSLRRASPAARANPQVFEAGDAAADDALAFLDAFVDDALARGAPRYNPPDDDDDDDDDDDGPSSSGASAFKIDACAARAAPPPRRPSPRWWLRAVTPR